MSRPNLSCGTRHRPPFIGAALIGPVKHTGCLTGSGPAARPAGTRRCDTPVHNENTEYGSRMSSKLSRQRAQLDMHVASLLNAARYDWRTAALPR